MSRRSWWYSGDVNTTVFSRGVLSKVRTSPAPPPGNSASRWPFETPVHLGPSVRPLIVWYVLSLSAPLKHQGTDGCVDEGKCFIIFCSEQANPSLKAVPDRLRTPGGVHGEEFRQ